MHKIIFILCLILLSQADEQLGFFDISKDETFFSKFFYRSENSSFGIEFAYPEVYAPLNMRIYWDSPISWVDCFNMRLPCLKKQEILQQLSSGQKFSLDPNLNSWCQTIPLSPIIARELGILIRARRNKNTWFTWIPKILVNLVATEASSRAWLTSFGLIDSEIFTPHDLPEHEIQHNETNDSLHSGLSLLPKVVQLAWENHLAQTNEAQQARVHNWIYCKSPEVELQFIRPVWWFFTIERCEATRNFLATMEGLPLTPSISGLKFAYRMILRNGLRGDLFHEYLSAQQFGSLEMELLFFVVMLVILCVSILIMYRLVRLHVMHPTAICWFCSIGLRFIAHFMSLIATLRLAIQGFQTLFLNSIAQLLFGGSTSAFFAALLLMSSGYTMLHHNLTRTRSIVLLVTLILYTLANVSCRIAEEFLQYTGDVLSRYHSAATYVMTGVQLAACIVYLSNMGYTIFKWPSKRSFLLRTALLSSVWFWYIPLWICITVELAAKQYTETVIRVWDEIVNVTAYVLLMLLLRPQNANAVFPYHARMQQAREQTPQQASLSESLKSKEQVRTIKTPGQTRAATKMPAIGGKPGDMPPPGFSLAKNLSHLEPRPRSSPSKGRRRPGVDEECSSIR